MTRIDRNFSRTTCTRRLYTFPKPPFKSICFLCSHVQGWYSSAPFICFIWSHMWGVQVLFTPTITMSTIHFQTWWFKLPSFSLLQSPPAAHSPVLKREHQDGHAWPDFICRPKHSPLVCKIGAGATITFPFGPRSGHTCTFFFFECVMSRQLSGQGQWGPPTAVNPH